MPRLSQPASETNQQPSERLSFQDILTKALESTHAKYVTFVTFIYLTVQFFAIVTGTKIGVPDSLRFPTIIISIIIIASYTFYKARILFYQNQSLYEQLAKPKNPSILINENLRYHDVELAIYCLIKKLVDSSVIVYADNTRKKFDTEKNIIIGIDRGGAIVGGLLGKGLRLAANTFAIYYANPPMRAGGVISSINSSKCLESIDFSCVEKVILVDDAIRTGRSMEIAVKMLDEIKETHNFEYTIVCILNVADVGHREVNPDFFVYQTRNIDLKLPWDETHWDIMQSNREFDKLCSKITFE